MQRKNFSICQAIVCLVVVGAFFSSCVTGFSNARNQVPPLYSKIYLPAANDTSAYSGNSSRLSYAIRNVLASRTDVELTALKDARLAIQIKILNRQQTIQTVDSCNNPGTTTVASNAFECSFIHPELTGNKDSPRSINQPSVSPSTESLYLVVDVKAIDLNNGAVLWAKHYYAGNISPVVFNEIGDTDSRTLTYMSNKPDLHGLRHQEAVDNAVQSFSNAIANDIRNNFFPSLPKEEQQGNHP